ncbi:MAG: T9SS type A sorting domain-containing protein [Patescibacteria group bacterium]
MKKITLLLSLFLFTGLLFAQSEQTQKPATIAEQTIVYPNPVESLNPVNVTLPLGVEVKAVSFVKMNGWELISWSRVNQNQQQLRLSLPEMSTGVHAVRLELKKGGFITKKLLVVR